MRDPDQSQWDKWEIENELHKFIYLRWDELFSESAYESWQVRTSNFRTLLVEAAESADIATHVPFHHTNLSKIIDELKLVCGDDPIVRSRFPETDQYVATIERQYKTAAAAATSDYSQLKRTAEVVLANTSDYCAEVMNEIRAIEYTKPEKFKKDLYQLLLLLAIEVKNRGFSDRYIRQCSQLLTSCSSGDFSSRLHRLLDCFSSERSEYVCMLLVRGTSRSADASPIGIENAMPEDVPTFKDQKRFLDQDADASVFRICTQAMDPYSAHEEAQRRLQGLFAVRRLYEPLATEPFVHPLAVVMLGDAAELVSGARDQPRYLKDSNNPDDNVTNLVSLLTVLTEPDQNHIRASLQYYRLSLIARNDESKLVNLWIALESLFQSADGNIITKMAGCIPPIMASSYVRDVLRSVSIDMRTRWRKSPSTEIQKHLAKSSTHVLHPTDILGFLLRNDDDDAKTQFLNYVSDNPLLLFRLYNLRSGLFSSPKGMSDRLMRHNRNIDWQLRRIYRVRNKIMHQGIVSMDLAYFLGHLHTYYLNTIHSIIQALRRCPSWTIAHALENVVINYNTLLDDLKSNRDLNFEKLYQSSVSAHAKRPGWTAKT